MKNKNQTMKTIVLATTMLAAVATLVPYALQDAFANPCSEITTGSGGSGGNGGNGGNGGGASGSGSESGPGFGGFGNFGIGARGGDGAVGGSGSPGGTVECNFQGDVSIEEPVD
jgi:hypothetical protein